jgi:hypothetical protein
VDKIYYNTDASTSYQEYIAPLSVTSAGTTTVSYYATDKVGNQGEAKTFTVKIDKSAPKAASTVRTADATGVARGVNFKATFSEKMDPSYITRQTFKLYKEGSTTPLSATVSYAPPPRRLRSIPLGALLRGIWRGGPSTRQL